jgi:hypothetical protein
VGVRHYPVPTGARDGVLGATATLDDIDLAATLGNEWAGKVLATENGRLLASMLGSDPVLPMGLAVPDIDDLIVTGLIRGDEVWTASGWQPAAIDDREPIGLDSDEVAFVARALASGSAVALRGYTPVALLSAIGAAGADLEDLPAGSSDLPADARVLAVVDDLDRNAVIDVVAVTPGPHVLRRHDGKWETDDGWIAVLRSVKPPPVVPLEDATLGSVLQQVDEATAGEPFELTGAPKKKPTVASAWDLRADQMAIEFAIHRALIAAPLGKAMSKATPGGRMPAKLREYWAFGEGAAKIRWGTPGAWTRCHRYLSKYVGPFRAKGTCTNLGKLRGGKGVAWDVG